FIDGMVGLLRETKDDTVGGLLLVAAVQDGGVTAIGFEDDPEGRKARVGVAVKDGRFVAYGADGREVVLRFPGELEREPPEKPLVLSDLKEASRAELERRASLRALLDPNRPPTKWE